MARHFSIPCGDNAHLEVIIAEPALRTDNLTLVTWTSSFVLASVLHKLPVDLSLPSSIPVLEIGAGTGLVGLTAAALWKSPVVLTDLPVIVPGIIGNVELNSTIVKDLIRCGSLDWSSPNTLQLEDGVLYEADKHKAQVILAADTIYSEEHPELLSKTISRWLAPNPSARAILTYPLRVAYIDYIRELWELLEASGLEAIMEGREQADATDWDDELLCEWVVFAWKPNSTTLDQSVENRIT